MILNIYLLGLVSSLSCKDMSGNNIQWFSIIKTPRAVSDKQGLEFMYLDPNSQKASIQPSLLNDVGALSHTLSQLNNKEISSFLFNDQPPVAGLKLKLSSSTQAHAKGVVMYTKTEGLYLVHSIPEFPKFTVDGKINSTVDYSQTTYGQNLMCVSLSSQQLFDMLGVMALIQPLVYHKNIVLDNENVTRVTQDLIPDLPSSLGISLVNGQFFYIAKSRFSGLYLWDNSVTQFFNAGVDVESWGRPYLPSTCPPNSPYPALNILTIKVSNYSWKNTQDHSKWGIVDQAQVVCYGDMNRMTSQLSRGGGTLCLKLDWFYQVHKSIITGVSPCNTSVTRD